MVYAVLAGLAWRARRKARGMKLFLADWSWTEAWGVILFCALYAVSDEVHQTFVATRLGDPVDVLIDSAGALGGMLAIWLAGRWKRRW